MQRRSFLTAAAPSTSALAGCLGGDSGSGTPSDGDGTTPTSTDASTGSFERKEVEGEMVPLVPVDVTREWYAAGSATFADARGEGQYEQAHIEGAVWSPAPDGRGDDPLEALATDERIVCYCGCPHHLSSLRAASLMRTATSRSTSSTRGSSSGPTGATRSPGPRSKGRRASSGAGPTRPTPGSRCTRATSRPTSGRPPSSPPTAPTNSPSGSPTSLRTRRFASSRRSRS